MIHFLIDAQTDIAGLDSWDPDAEPGRFANGVGHLILELHRRLLQRGLVTTIGTSIPEGTTLLVVMARRMSWARPLARVHYAWRLRRHRVVFVRNDLTIDFVRRFRVDVEVAPSRTFLTSEVRGAACVLPPLPQRGLIPRDPSRGDRIERVCLKANPRNIPEQLLERSMLDRLDELGVSLDIDAPATESGADQRWNDFGDVDVAICARRDGQETICKPATKLLNAWAAGVIPLASREPAYEEIGTDRRDVLFFDDVDEIPELLHLLRTDDELRTRLWLGIAAAAADQPTIDEQIDAWWTLFRGAERPPSTWRGLRSLAFAARREDPFVLIRDGVRAARELVGRRPARPAPPA